MGDQGLGSKLEDNQGGGEAVGAWAWEGLLGTHKGLWIKLEDARRPPGLRPPRTPLPLPRPPAAQRSSTAFILFLPPPSPKAHRHNTSFL